MFEYRLVEFKTLGDERGSLIAIEEGYNAPFDIKFLNCFVWFC